MTVDVMGFQGSCRSPLMGNDDYSSWWNQINQSGLWQDRIFNAIAALYAVVGIFALVQLVRIQLRTPEYGWTTQKVFHLLNFVVNVVRSLVFVFRRNVQKLQSDILQYIVLNIPSLAFFTTFVILVLFRAEIYYQARAVSTDGLRPTFYTIDGVVYAFQILLWSIIWWKPVPAWVIVSKLFFAGVYLFAALGFLLYGGRRARKLQEVGSVGTVCFLCFLVRCVMMFFDAFGKDVDLDDLNHPVLNLLLYYLLMEILPCAAVMFILRALPPKREIRDD